ncbi:MAG: DUF3108 domain-containing protein [Deltaproteobacteria bacterium]|nr:DUF3108 domain-containing protein [Deltaproteobacteria bacterium]
MRALALIALVGCTGVKPVHQRERAAPLAGAVTVVPGELMELEVTLRGIKVGHVQTAIGWPGVVDGHRAVIVRSRGKTDGLLALIGDITWELTSTIDLDSGEAISSVEEAWVEFAGEKHHERQPSHEGEHDIHATVGAVRGWRSKPGDRSELDCAIGGAHLQVALWHSGRGFAAHQPAIHYEGIVQDEFPIAAWVSDDAARVPLRLTAQSPWGEIAVDLVDYQVPADR